MASARGDSLVQMRFAAEAGDDGAAAVPPLPSRNFIVTIADPGGEGEEAEKGRSICAPLLWVEQK